MCDAGLDPAKPFFELTDRAGRLIKDDAELVDIIHTNAGYLGRTDLLGHVDFFPNGGTWQVGCNIDVWGEWTGTRSPSSTSIDVPFLLSIICDFSGAFIAVILDEVIKAVSSILKLRSNCV